jgi:hypothetical protein
MYKRKYGLDEKETTFQYKYGSPLDFHSHSLMNLNVESHVADMSRWGHEGRECKRNVQYNIFIVFL